MTNITLSASPARRRIKVRVPRTPAVRRTTALPAQVWMVGVSLALAVAAVMYAGAAHADEGLTTCTAGAPMALAKRPAAGGISYAPHRSSIHRHHLPAMLRKPAHEVGCTPESLPAAVSPLSVPAVGEAPAPVVAEAIPPVLAAEAAPAPVVAAAIPPVAAVDGAPTPVVADVVTPVSMETPRGAVAAAAMGDPVLAAAPLLALATGIAVCVVSHGCGGHSSTTGGHSVSTAGTTGTVGK